jgi:hypothetical protein
VNISSNRDQMVRKAQPTPSAVHVDRPLTQFSLGIFQDASSFVADRLFPTIPVAKQSDLYREYPRGAFNRDQMEKRAPGAESAGVGYETSTTPYFADVWALHVDIDEQTEENADDEVDLDFEATTLLSHQALINRDRQWASQFFTTSVWTGEETLAGSDQWSDYSGSDPLQKIEEKIVAMEELTGQRPNKAVMGRQVWSQLKNHPDLVDRVNRGQTSGPAQALLANFAELIEVDEVMVARGIYNSAAEGAADAHSFIFGKHFLLMHVADSPGRYTPSAGYTFAWRGFSGANVAGTRMKRFERRSTSSRRVEIESAYDQKLVSADLGSIIINAVA